MNSTEQGFRIRRKKLNAMKALATRKAKYSKDDSSDDGDDEAGDAPQGGAGGRTRGGGSDGRGRFGILVNSGDSDLRIRPPTPPLPARGQPKISPSSPRADARPIGECKSSWGGDHRGGRGRGEGRVTDARVPPRGRVSTGGGRISTGGHPFGGAGKKIRLPPPRVVGGVSQQPRGEGGGSPAKQKIRPPPPRVVGIVSQQPRGEGNSNPAKEQPRAGTGGVEEFQGRPRDDPLTRPRAIGGTGASSSSGIARRDSRDSFRSDEGRERGGRAKGDRDGAVSDRSSRREGSDARKKLARKSGGGRPGSSDDGHRGRSQGERDRLDGMGGGRKRSPSSSVEREDRDRRKLKLRQKKKSDKQSASRESTKRPPSLKRRRSSGQDGADRAQDGLSDSSRPVHSRGGTVPRAATSDPVDETLLGFSAIASPSSHRAR